MDGFTKHWVEDIERDKLDEYRIERLTETRDRLSDRVEALTREIEKLKGLDKRGQDMTAKASSELIRKREQLREVEEAVYPDGEPICWSKLKGSDRSKLIESIKGLFRGLDPIKDIKVELDRELEMDGWDAKMRYRGLIVFIDFKGKS